jgi:mannonate dehydratase
METAFAFCFGYIIALFQANGWDPYGADVPAGLR